MTIRRGTSNIRRTHATNFIQNQANARLQEAIKPFQKKGLNAMQVDSFEVLLYQRAYSTQVCTCKQTEVVAQHLTANPNLPPNVVNPNSTTDDEIVIDYARPLFGTRGTAATNLDYVEAIDLALDDDDGLDSSYLDDDETPSTTSENLFSANSDCGICYRTGFVPGYNLYGWDRQLLTTYTLSDMYGYHVNASKAPHLFEKQDTREGFVEFLVSIPKYFSRVKFSIRSNHSIVADYLLLEDNTALTLESLHQSAGKVLKIRCSSIAFTHVVLEFDLGCEPVHANISQMSKTMDWTQLSTLGSTTFSLPCTIAEVQSADFIYIPKRYQVWKVVDTPYLRTASGFNLDWAVSSRIVQPQEPSLLISKGRWLD